MSSFTSLHVLLLCASHWQAHAATLSNSARDQFDGYMASFGRTYAKGSEEYELRRELYGHRLNEVSVHNSRPGRLWKAEAGVFADRTEEERAAARGWRRMHGIATQGGVLHSSSTSGVSLLETQDIAELPTVDWRFLATSKQITDQSECGSCWAATTASTLEAHFEIHHGRNTKFSVQEILSCTPNPRQCGGQGGCQGATVELGMEWVLHNGLADEKTVPYQARDMACPRISKRGSVELSSDRGGKYGNGMGLLGWQTLMPKKQ
jgi:cathepsin L